MEFVRSMLGEQRRRLVATLMRHLEVEAYPHLSKQQQDQLRRKVLDSVDRYHDICLDMLKSSVNDGSVGNQDAIRLLVSIKGDIRRALERETV